MSQQGISITTLLYRHSPRLLLFAVAVGALAGGLYSLIIPFVLHGLAEESQGAYAPLFSMIQGAKDAHPGSLFFLVCLLILSAKAASVIVVNNIAKSSTAQLRLSIAQKINTMHIDTVERLGFPRLLNILIDDVNNVAAAAMAIPMIVVSSVTVTGMLGYLATLNITVFFVVLIGIVAGVALFRIPVALATGLYEKARILRDTIQEGLRGLVLGVYELKLDRAKSRMFIDSELRVPTEYSTRLEKVGDGIFHMAGMASDLLSFFIIGGIVFLLPNYVTFPAAERPGVVMVLLYITAPVAHVLGMLHHLQLGRVSIARIRELDGCEAEADPDPAGEIVPPSIPSWKVYRLERAYYQYAGESDGQKQGFSVGPVDLVFHPGQINFIVGGNGSGKSTLSKLISQHYLPVSGSVFLDDEAICKESIWSIRSRLSVIYSNYYLFGRLHRKIEKDDEKRISHLLEKLQLSGKTEFKDGKFTTTRLSDGQRRRLALLVALMEDKDIYVFDEWAADQDPVFKKVFYHEILQELKRRGKLLIVITHDDRYFACADRVIVMEDGRVASVTEQKTAFGLLANAGR